MARLASGVSDGLSDHRRAGLPRTSRSSRFASFRTSGRFPPSQGAPPRAYPSVPAILEVDRQQVVNCGRRGNVRGGNRESHGGTGPGHARCRHSAVKPPRTCAKGEHLRWHCGPYTCHQRHRAVERPHLFPGTVYTISKVTPTAHNPQLASRRTPKRAQRQASSPVTTHRELEGHRDRGNGGVS